MLPYLPEPADGLEFSFKISNDRTSLKVYVRNTSGIRVTILDPVRDPMHETLELIEAAPGKTPNLPTFCGIPGLSCDTIRIENGAVAQVSQRFRFDNTQAGLYYGKATFFDPKHAENYRRPQEPVQPVDMRSVRFLVRVYPSGKYKLLKIVD